MRCSAFLLVSACALPPVSHHAATTPSSDPPPTPPTIDTGVPSLHEVVTVAGVPGVAGLGADGPALGSALYWPMDLTLGPDGRPYVMDWNNHRVRRLEADGSVTTVLAGFGTGGADGWLSEPTCAVFAPDGTLYLVESLEVKRVDLADHGYDRFCEGDFGVCDHPPLLPTGVAIDPEGRLLVADALEGSILRLDDDGVVRRIAGTGTPGFNGDGPALQTQLFGPYDPGIPPPLGSRIELSGHTLWIADTGNSRIRALDLDLMEITTVAAGLTMPGDVAAGPDGALYVADWNHSCLRVIRDGTVDTFAGTCGDGLSTAGWVDAEDARDAAFYNPYGVMVDPSGALYVADTDNEVIRRVGL